jgi:hypothetical protein
MKMVSRAPTALSLNRSLVVLAALLLAALAAIAGTEQLVGTSLLPPAPPVYAPAENSAAPAPAVDVTSAPLPTTDSAVPGAQTGASPLPTAQTPAPVRIGAPPARLPSLDGNDSSSPYAPQGADGKFPGFEGPSRN